MTDATVARPKPQIDDPDELDRLVRQIVERVDPVAIYLFGSRARGDARADSDYDLMIVVPDEAADVRETLWDMVRHRSIDANPFVSRARSFAWRRHEVGTLEYEVEVDGLQLYPRGRRAFPADVGRRPHTMNVNVVEEWLRRVEKDLGVARLCCDADDPIPDQAAYHVQQAAEKLTKAALVAQQARPRKGHNIEEFTSLLPDDFPLKNRFEAFHRFSKFAWAHRYPEYPGQEPIPEPSVEQARTWLDEVTALKIDCERWLAQHAGGTRGDA